MVKAMFFFLSWLLPTAAYTTGAEPGNSPPGIGSPAEGIDSTYIPRHTGRTQKAQCTSTTCPESARMEHESSGTNEGDRPPSGAFQREHSSDVADSFVETHASRTGDAPLDVVSAVLAALANKPDPADLDDAFFANFAEEVKVDARASVDTEPWGASFELLEFEGPAKQMFAKYEKREGLETWIGHLKTMEEKNAIGHVVLGYQTKRQYSRSQYDAYIGSATS